MADNVPAVPAEIVGDDHTPTAPAVRATDPSGGGIAANLFGVSDPDAAVAAATAAARAIIRPIEEQRLYVEIGGGRRHVQVEGWTLLGAILGVSPVETWTRPVPDGDGEWSEPAVEKQARTLHSKFCRCGRGAAADPVDGCQTYTKDVAQVVAAGRGGWESRVEARLRDGTVVGAAEAECRWSEATWSTRDSYALRSMAQTRATSKALRLPLSFVMVLAGFQSTPAEEIPAGGFDDGQADQSGYECPTCAAPVYDHRAQAAGSNRPKWKCSSPTCDGGKPKDDGGSWGWASWESWPWLLPEVESGDYTNAAKRRVLALVEDYTSQDDVTAAAAAVWEDACDDAGVVPAGPVTYADAARIIRACAGLASIPTGIGTSELFGIDPDPDESYADYGGAPYGY